MAVSSQPFNRSAHPILSSSGLEVDGRDGLVLMIGLGCVMVLVALGVVRAYESAPPAIVGTFDYAYLVFAAVWGLSFFGERLNTFTLIGIRLILAAGMLSCPVPNRAQEWQLRALRRSVSVYLDPLYVLTPRR
ncbi:hypothetical protein [Aureimonas altamirensis]|uniref:hypothetical protein n=1 Tax=Aureimonas altamirensis TaxID=370622 RepID=UPI00203726F8|nr:hypothetical protein [Aureimonas altamirensis]